MNKKILDLTRRNIDSIRNEIDRGADIDPAILAELEAELSDLVGEGGD